jgi:hypothetical protein
MLAFVRPANWAYDLRLFRSATDDEVELEAMLAAIALDGQGLWVIEVGQQPVAFAWTAVEHGRVRLRRLHVQPGYACTEVLRLLLERIRREHVRRPALLEASAGAVTGAGAQLLQSVGLRPQGAVWTKELAA